MRSAAYALSAMRDLRVRRRPRARRLLARSGGRHAVPPQDAQRGHPRVPPLLPAVGSVPEGAHGRAQSLRRARLRRRRRSCVRPRACRRSCASTGSAGSTRRSSSATSSRPTATPRPHGQLMESMAGYVPAIDYLPYSSLCLAALCETGPAGKRAEWLGKIAENQRRLARWAAELSGELPPPLRARRGRGRADRPAACRRRRTSSTRRSRRPPREDSSTTRPSRASSRVVTRSRAGGSGSPISTSGRRASATRDGARRRRCARSRRSSRRWGAPSRRPRAAESATATSTSSACSRRPRPSRPRWSSTGCWSGSSTCAPRPRAPTASSSSSRKTAQPFVRAIGTGRGTRRARAHGALGRPGRSRGTPSSKRGATLRPLVVDEAVHDPRVAADPYVASRAMKSILAVPVQRRGKLVATLYFENNLVTHAFTQARLARARAPVGADRRGAGEQPALREAEVRGGRSAARRAHGALSRERGGGARRVARRPVRSSTSSRGCWCPSSPTGAPSTCSTTRGKSTGWRRGTSIPQKEALVREFRDTPGRRTGARRSRRRSSCAPARRSSSKRSPTRCSGRPRATQEHLRLVARARRAQRALRSHDRPRAHASA